MPVASDKGGGSFQLPPVGTHPARCIHIIDLGTQRDVYGPTQKKKLIRKVRINWELPNEKAIFDEEKGEESFMVGAEYTLSLNERANLRHVLESWRGEDFTEAQLKGFDMKVLIGKACMVAVIHRKSKQNPGRVYAQVTSVVKLPKGMGCPKASLERINYDISNGEGGDYAKLPEWIQEKIQNSEEWNAQPESDGDPEDWGPEEGTEGEQEPEEPEEPEPPRPPRKKVPVRKGPPPEPEEDPDEIPF
jgi:hypothetical protein